jgi:hypothetical protein
MALATLEGMNNPLTYPGRTILQCWACATLFPAVNSYARYCSPACKMWATRRIKAKRPWHFLRQRCNELIQTDTNEIERRGAIWYEAETTRTLSHEQGNAGTLCFVPVIVETTHQPIPSSSVPLLRYRASDGVAAPQQESGITGAND